MPPLPSSSSSHPPPAPYPSPSSRKPKSSRQQFSACGACRMRRVKCDLKDLYEVAVAAGIPPTCTNCTERGLKCVDEYADIKSVKLLRRGRRLQQVQALYGPTTLSDLPSPLSPISPTASSPSFSSIRLPTMQFFRSDFFRRLSLQRPLFDKDEFSSRLAEHEAGNEDALGPVGQLLLRVLTLWAISYGVDEGGFEEPHTSYNDVKKRKQTCNDYSKDLLRAVDVHGILRKPTWDGVRVLLLLTPLTEEVLSPLDRLVMYECALSQVYTLCTIAPASSVKSSQGEYGDAMMRSRVFWYAFIHEGISTGLRGGRLNINEEDLEAFLLSLPSSTPDQIRTGPSQTTRQFSFLFQFASAPLQLSKACRQVHGCLTGPRARKTPEMDFNQLQRSWDLLDHCWTAFDELRGIEAQEFIQADELEQLIGRWQIFIFESFHVIREALKQRIIAARENASLAVPLSGDELAKLGQLYAMAEDRCHGKLQLVLSLIRKHVNANTFAYEGSLARDGVFFASYMAADSHSSEELESCLKALRQCRWAFCKSDEREQTLQHMRENQAANVELPFAKMEESASPPLAFSSTQQPLRGPGSAGGHRSGDSGRMGRTPTGGDVSPAVSSPAGVSRPPSHGSGVSHDSGSAMRALPMTRARPLSVGSSPQLDRPQEDLSGVVNYPLYGGGVGTTPRFGMSASLPDTSPSVMPGQTPEYGATTYYYEPTASLSRLASSGQNTGFHQGDTGAGEFGTGNFSVDYYLK